MITGNEMQDIQGKVMKAIRQEILKQSGEGGDLLWACKDALKVGTNYYVYSVYSPTVYGRRYYSGGLADEENWITTTLRSATGARIDIEDRTPAGDSGMANPPPDPVFYLSDIIEAGANGPKWTDPDWPGPRPYMETAMLDGCKKGAVIDYTLKGVVEGAELSGI